MKRITLFCLLVLFGNHLHSQQIEDSSFTTISSGDNNECKSINNKNFNKDSLTKKNKYKEIKSIVEYLADDNKLGRRNGSVQSYLISEWIKEYFERKGLVSINNDYFQNYSYINTNKDTIKERNVVGLLKSTNMNNQNYIIVSAHFDHLGTVSSEIDSIYNGANDNATGVALTLSLISELKQVKCRSYNVIFAEFSGEEEGLNGSAYFAENLPVPREKIQINLNFDMLGRTGNTPRFKYFISGCTYTNLKDVILDFNKNEKWKLDVDTTSMNNFLFLMSDNYSFVKSIGKDMINIPAHTFSTDTPDDAPNYHSIKDESQFIDYTNLASFSEYIYRLIDYIGNNKIEIKWVKEIIEHNFELELDGVQLKLIKKD